MRASTSPSTGRVTVFVYGQAGHASKEAAAAAFVSQAERCGHHVELAPTEHFARDLAAALPSLEGDVVVFQHASAAYSAESWARLVAPIARDEADVVLGQRPNRSLADAALERFARLTLDGLAVDAATGQFAVRRTALVDTTLTDEADEAELLVKLAKQLYRFTEVRIDAEPTPTQWAAWWQRAKTFMRYATTHDDADNAHPGYSTLGHLESSAPNYNAWLGEQFRAHAGQRVLEVGAGIGTITSHLATGREKVIALEVEPFYVRRLTNRFRGQPNVVPHLSDVALADWQNLKTERLDTVVLSNVLEHIADDGQAIRLFSRVLSDDGKLLIFVPALTQLFGTLDRAVGHHRRYTPAALRTVLEQNGFDVEELKFMNLVGIAGWFVNGRVLKRQVLSPVQLKLYDGLAPVLASLESRVRLPIGLSLFCVARKRVAP